MFPESGFLQVAFLTGGIAFIVDAAKEIHAPRAIVHVKGSKAVVSLTPVQGLGIRGIEVEAEAFTLSSDGADAYHAAYGGIVLGTGIGDDLHTLNLVALQAV